MFQKTASIIKQDSAYAEINYSLFSLLILWIISSVYSLFFNCQMELAIRQLADHPPV